MKKLYIIISLVLLSTSIIFISCSNCESLGGTDCIVETYCKTDEDCKDEKEDNSVCVNSICHADPCLSLYCVVGTCIHHDNPDTTDNKELAYCQCDENSLPYDYFQDSSHPLICTPKCETHNDCSEAYVNLGHQIAGVCIKGQCNEVNHCDTADDCPDGDICDYNHCKAEPIDG